GHGIVSHVERKLVEVQSRPSHSSCVIVTRENHASRGNLRAFRSSLVAPGTRPWFPAVARVRQLLATTTKIAAPKKVMPPGCPKKASSVIQGFGVHVAPLSLSLSLLTRLHDAASKTRILPAMIMRVPRQ
ncbi:unnamed protein product, partial [Ectocarpus fasciculatus]